MPNDHVISAFLDNEPFDPRALAEALADPAGRGLLVDLIALRTMVQPNEALLARAGSHKRPPLLVRLALAAAVLAVAVFGGYQLGERSQSDAAADPPAPTHVVKPSASWQEIGSGGSR